MADRTIALGQFVEDRAFAVIYVVVGSRRIVYNDIVRSEADDFAVSVNATTGLSLNFSSVILSPVMVGATTSPRYA